MEERFAGGPPGSAQPMPAGGDHGPRGRAQAKEVDPMPVHPAEPDGSECCGEGCIRCVMDRYDEAMERYREELSAWQSRHAAAPH